MGPRDALEAVKVWMWIYCTDIHTYTHIHNAHFFFSLTLMFMTASIPIDRSDDLSLLVEIPPEQHLTDT